MDKESGVRNPYTVRGLERALGAVGCGKLDPFLTCPGAQIELDSQVLKMYYSCLKNIFIVLFSKYKYNCCNLLLPAKYIANNNLEKFI